MVALLMTEHTEQVQSVGVFFFVLDDLLIQLRSLTYLSGLVHFKGSRQKV